MVVFPDDAGKYLDDLGDPYTPGNFPIATAVRISAGYPGFFPPIALTDAATRSPGAMVDGGVAASFPVFLFDDPKPQWPTWAFRLFGGAPPERPPNNPIKGLFWPIDMIKDVIDTAKQFFAGQPTGTNRFGATPASIVAATASATPPGDSERHD